MPYIPSNLHNNPDLKFCGNALEVALGVITNLKNDLLVDVILTSTISNTFNHQKCKPYVNVSFLYICVVHAGSRSKLQFLLGGGEKSSQNSSVDNDMQILTSEFYVAPRWAIYYLCDP